MDTRMGVDVRVDDIERARLAGAAARKLSFIVILTTVLLLLVARDLYREFSGGNLGFSIQLPLGLSSYFPALVLIALLVGAIALPMLGLGRSPHQLVRPSDIDVSSTDILGAPQTVKMIDQLIKEYRNFATLKESFGASPPRAILFEGPPGTGKTMAAKVIARESGVPFLFVSGSAFQAMYYGQSSKKVRSYFKHLRKLARNYGGAIGFIEEFDAIGASRSSMGAPQTSDGVSGVVAELLVQLQSFESRTWLERVGNFEIFSPLKGRPSPRFLVIAATNRASELDPALMRPGRFDRSIHFELPNASARKEMLFGLLDVRRINCDVDVETATIEKISSMSSGLSQASIFRLVEEAGVLAFHDDRNVITDADLWNAFTHMSLGRNAGAPYGDFEKLVVAVHEAGHATYRWFGGGKADLGVVSILKRGEALGLTAAYHLEDRYLVTKDDLLDEIAALFSGMVAEELIFREISTGSASDLKRASSIALKYVCSFGMGSSLVSTGELSPQAEIALLTSDGSVKVEVELVLEEGKRRCSEIITTHLSQLWRLSLSLYETEELDAKAVERLLGQRSTKTSTIVLSDFSPLSQ